VSPTNKSLFFSPELKKASQVSQSGKEDFSREQRGISPISLEFLWKFSISLEPFYIF
jgi:hypothetical protein